MGSQYGKGKRENKSYIHKRKKEVKINFEKRMNKNLQGNRTLFLKKEQKVKKESKNNDTLVIDELNVWR